jgi:hypothetical protein
LLRLVCDTAALHRRQNVTKMFWQIFRAYAK